MNLWWLIIILITEMVPCFESNTSSQYVALLHGTSSAGAYHHCHHHRPLHEDVSFLQFKPSSNENSSWLVKMSFSFTFCFTLCLYLKLKKKIFLKISNKIWITVLFFLQRREGEDWQFHNCQNMWHV